nr:putative ribonuclease H-like domain-containing protein [Tanacetum cinerariifolium]
MLADAKLPITFWAKAVNTACYVQNRVLVNKSHNKTPYEVFNGRSPAIGFLKPFGCYVMILNTLNNLGKFEEKGDEGYFIGYSMSSKAFRVFNKRTRRVEENLHAEFLENKAIEKGFGPNWLFDFNSLTKSMNYVPVDAGIISTNISCTKDATSQEVKKNVSSLRYIALPNWAYDARLEFSSSKPQDHCSTKVPEGSRNPNPTAFTSNPPADPMETLTVETPIPTDSSPVPTAYSTDSQEPSSDARLISKKVANQEETPSLDNILSLTNRFEYILGGTTNSDESNGVEADISNMETAITASPTPTLRIHKDHPKGRIIGPLDTPIQTRNKSKEVEEQSFIAIIHQKTDPALLQFCLFLCFLSQVEPKKIYDALQDPSWDERGIVIRNKARLVAQGHTQEEEIDYDEVFAHVARIEAIRLFLAYASFIDFTVYYMDVKSAFLCGTIDEEVYDINQIDEDDMEEIDIKWNMALLSMRADKFWKKTGKKISIQGSDMDWSYMANNEEDHALVADEVAPTEFALMANTSAKSKVFENSLCSKDCKKNNDSLNRLAQVESRLVKYKEREVKYCEKIKTLEFRNESNNECIKVLKKKLEILEQEKEGLDGKLAGLLTASKDLDNLIESQRADKNKEGLGYNAVPPPPAQIYSSPKKDFASGDDQNRNPSVSDTVALPITPKPFIKFMKSKDSQSKSKIDETEISKKPPVKNFPPVNRKFSTGSRNFPTANKKFPTASRKFPAGSTKCSTADMGMKGKA